MNSQKMNSQGFNAIHPWSIPTARYPEINCLSKGLSTSKNLDNERTHEYSLFRLCTPQIKFNKYLGKAHEQRCDFSVNLGSGGNFDNLIDKQFIVRFLCYTILTTNIWSIIIIKIPTTTGIHCNSGVQPTRSKRSNKDRTLLGIAARAAQSLALDSIIVLSPKCRMMIGAISTANLDKRTLFVY